MAAMSPEVVEPVLLFCDTFSHPENEVSVKAFENFMLTIFLQFFALEICVYNVERDV